MQVLLSSRMSKPGQARLDQKLLNRYSLMTGQTRTRNRTTRTTASMAGTVTMMRRSPVDHAMLQTHRDNMAVSRKPVRLNAAPNIPTSTGCKEAGLGTTKDPWPARSWFAQE